jgi:FkbM family methyltransferase
MNPIEQSTRYQHPKTKREKLAALFRPWLEAIGISWLSRPGLNGLDMKLATLMPRRGGFFVEAGAYDGFRQSNTYYLARKKGWRGVLIEPLPALADLCRKLRTESATVCCALGPPELAGSTLQLRYAGMMTMARGSFGDDAEERGRAAAGLTIQGLPTDEVLLSAPLRTITEILTEMETPADFDLLCLDVEGMEVEVLRGLDLKRFLPKAICIEVRHENLAAVIHLLNNHYARPLYLTTNERYCDCFFARIADDSGEYITLPVKRPAAN